MLNSLQLLTRLRGLHVGPPGVGGRELDLRDGVLGGGVVHVGREVVLVLVLHVPLGRRRPGLLRHAATAAAGGPVDTNIAKG